MKKLKRLFWLVICFLIITPVFTEAAPYGDASGENGSSRPCPSSICYNSTGSNRGVKVTLYRYEYDNGKKITKLCSYQKRDVGPSPYISNGKAFVKWVENINSGIIGKGKDIGIFSKPADGYDAVSAASAINFFASKGDCKAKLDSGEIVRPPADTTKYEEWLKTAEQYYVAVEPIVGLKTRNETSYKRRPIREQCNNSSTGSMRTFYDFLSLIYDSYTVTQKNNCPDNSGKKCIGPNYQKAMVGMEESESPIKLVNSKKVKDYKCAANSNEPKIDSKTGLQLVNTKNDYAIGIAYYWILDKEPVDEPDTEISTCPEKCGTNPNNDNYLACAESFCETYIGDYDPNNTDPDQTLQANKIRCITDLCLYNPMPNSCDSPVDPNNPTGPKNDPNDSFIPETNVNKSTSCGKTSGSYKSCQGKSTNTGVISERKYYSISCTEKTNFDFKDTSQTSLVPGELLEYNVKLGGNKTCKVYFDYVSWKIDYASFSPKDPTGNANRLEMKKLIEKFNNAFVPDVSGAIGSIENFKNTLGFQEYDIKKINVRSKYAEIINGENKDSADYKLVSRGPSSSNTDTITNSEIVEIPVIENGSIVSHISVNYYTTSSNRAAYYQMPGQCVRDAATGNVYTATGEKCDDGTKPKSGYYTSLKATPNNRLTAGQRHNVVAVATATGEGDYYISNTDTCPYNMNVGKCTLSIKSGDHISCTKNTYDSDIIVELSTENIPLNDITAKEIKLNDSTFDPSLMEDEDTISNTSPTCSNVKNTVYGKVKTKSGYVVECRLPVEFKGGCSCKLELVSGTNNIYELKNVNMPDPTGFYYKINGGEEIEVKPDLLNGKYLIKTEGVSLPLKIEGVIKNATGSVSCQIANSCESCSTKYKPSDTTAIEAYCKTNWMTDLAGYSDYDSCVNKCSTSACRQTYNPTDTDLIYEYCKTSFQDDPAGYETPEECRVDCSVKRCTKIFKAEELMEIKNYCKLYWDQDEARYQSYDDCVTGCSFTCNKLTATTYEGIITECNQHYSSWGFKTADNCATTCCVKSGTCSGGTDYVYRPINPRNPFPDSYLDNPTLSTDKQRKIGANWFGKDKYITEDLDDSTSGTDTENGKPEYEIILDESAIRKIRKDNEMYNSTKAKTGGNVYIDYVPYIDSSNSKKTIEYESKFIRDSDSNNGGGGFYDYFTFIDGSEKASIIDY